MSVPASQTGVLALADMPTDLEAIQRPLLRPEDLVGVHAITWHVVQDAAGVGLLVFVLDGSEVFVGSFYYGLLWREGLLEEGSEHLNWRSI
jgi:hypothetical protein